MRIELLCVEAITELFYLIADKTLVKRTISAGDSFTMSKHVDKLPVNNKIIEAKREFKKVKRKYYINKNDNNRRI